jgi:hypothetical protein
MNAHVSNNSQQKFAAVVQLLHMPALLLIKDGIRGGKHGRVGRSIRMRASHLHRNIPMPAVSDVHNVQDAEQIRLLDVERVRQMRACHSRCKKDTSPVQSNSFIPPPPLLMRLLHTASNSFVIYTPSQQRIMCPLLFQPIAPQLLLPSTWTSISTRVYAGLLMAVHQAHQVGLVNCYILCHVMRIACVVLCASLQILPTAPYLKSSSLTYWHADH